MNYIKNFFLTFFDICIEFFTKRKKKKKEKVKNKYNSWKEKRETERLEKKDVVNFDINGYGIISSDKTLNPDISIHPTKDREKESGYLYHEDFSIKIYLPKKPNFVRMLIYKILFGKKLCWHNFEQKNKNK